LRDLLHLRLALSNLRSRAIVHALNAGGASVSFVEIASDKGHDAFCCMSRLLRDHARLSRIRGARARHSSGHGKAVMTTSLKIAPGRFDLAVVADIVEPGSRVLDVGCGDGLLLQMLERQKQVDGRGVELSQRGVNDCVAKGLSVIQGDADTTSAIIPKTVSIM